MSSRLGIARPLSTPLSSTSGGSVLHSDPVTRSSCFLAGPEVAVAALREALDERGVRGVEDVRDLRVRHLELDLEREV